jgi:hypothetical protein
VQAKTMNNNLEETQEPTLEVNKTINTPIIESNVKPIVLPEIKSVQDDADINTDSLSKISKASTPTIAMPNVTKAKNKYIPLMADAVIFANYDDELPAIVNYYTQASEDEIILFYQASFKKELTKERMRGRLTLNYSTDDRSITVIISPQNNKYQVDVIMTLA